jgi:Tol biopolymer transport system component
MTGRDERSIGTVSRAGGAALALTLLASGCGQELDQPGGTGGRPAVTDPRRQVVFVSQRDGNAGIFVVNADGSGLERLTDDPPRTVGLPGLPTEPRSPSPATGTGTSTTT